MHSKVEKAFRDIILLLRPAHTAYMLIYVTRGIIVKQPLLSTINDHLIALNICYHSVQGMCVWQSCMTHCDRASKRLQHRNNKLTDQAGTVAQLILLQRLRRQQTCACPSRAADRPS